MMIYLLVWQIEVDKWLVFCEEDAMGAPIHQEDDKPLGADAAAKTGT